MINLVNLKEQEEKPKAIIMAGGAGVGKTFVTDKFKKIAEDNGWVVLNPDQYARNPDPEQRLSLAAAASKINKEVDSLAKSKDKPNIIWDTTANNPSKVKELQDAGYDVLMIMVYAHPSVAFEQNFARASKEGEDSLPPYVILKTWASSYNDPHIENYQKMFGDNFIIIDNTSKPGTDNAKIDKFNKAALQGGKSLEKHIGDIIKSNPKYYSSTQMVSKPANLSKDQQADFNSKVQELGLKLEEDDKEAMEKLYQKYFEKNNEVMPLKKVGRKNGMEEVYKSYMSKKVKKDAEKDRVYSDISSTIKNVGKSFLSIDDATTKAIKHIGSKKINELTQFLVDGILNESVEQITALFGGGFKPPTKGHLDVVLNGLKQNPEINNLKIIVGGGVRDGITQDQSARIWELYSDIGLIPVETDVIKASPFSYYKEYLRSNPDDKTYVFIGSRPDDEKDQIDVAQRSKFVKNYSDNVIPVEVATTGGISGTEARKLFKTDLESFKDMLPEKLTVGDVKRIIDILNNKSMDSTANPTFNRTEPLTPKKENIDTKSQAKHKGKSSPFGSAYEPVNEVTLIRGKDFGKDKLKEITPIIFLSHDNFKENEIKKLKKDLDSDPSISSRYVGIVVDLNKLKTDKGKIDFNKLIKVGNSIVNDIKNQLKNKFSKLDPVVYVGYNPKKSQIKDILGNKFIVLNRLDAGPIVVNSMLQFRASADEMAAAMARNPNFGRAFTKVKLNENATYSSKIDYKQQIKDLTKHMIKKGMNILPLPRVIFKHSDVENASQFLGKTAYYDPNNMAVVLYTEGRHPKDIVRSFAHEMIHHIQNLEDRLGGINTTNTMEDDNLNDIEREAYTKGNMTFRNWTDNKDGEEVTSLNEIGDASSKVFSWRKTKGMDPKPFKEITDENVDGIQAENIYEFETDLGTEYVVNFETEYDPDYQELDVEINFTTLTKRGNIDTEMTSTNKGEQYAVMATISDIMVNWINEWDKYFHISQVWIEPKVEEDEKEEMSVFSQRGRLYKIYLDKQLSRLNKSYEVEQKPNAFKMVPKFENSFYIDETIKNKDPFGLNQFARELIQDNPFQPVKEDVKSLAPQEEDVIFNKNCGCDKT